VRDDGSALTEFPAIAWWLARANSERNLLPADAEGEARAFEVMDFVVGTMHGQGFGRMFRPAAFAPSEADHEKVKARGREIFEGGLQLMDRALAGREHAAGDGFTVADAALFYVEFWAAGRMGMTLPPNLAGHYGRLTARPAVKRVLEAEGFGG
jgi:glutathione S-transferase